MPAQWWCGDFQRQSNGGEGDIISFQNKIVCKLSFSRQDKLLERMPKFAKALPCAKSGELPAVLPFLPIFGKEPPRAEPLQMRIVTWRVFQRTCMISAFFVTSPSSIFVFLDLDSFHAMSKFVQVPENKKKSEKQVGNRTLKLLPKPIVINTFGTLRWVPSYVWLSYHLDVLIFEAASVQRSKLARVTFQWELNRLGL